MTTLTDSGKIEHLRSFVKTHKNEIAFSLVMQEDDGSLTVHDRPSQPCYGEMREYKKGESKPGDLHSPFPTTGNPVGVGVTFRYPRSKGLLDMFTSPTGPWATVFNREFEYVMDGELVAGLVMLDTHYNPTHFVQMLILLRSCSINPGVVEKYGIDPNIALLLNLNFQNNLNENPGKLVLHNTTSRYGLGLKVVLKRWFASDPIIVAEGTFFDRTSYSRKEMDYQFGRGDDPPLGVLFKENGIPTAVPIEEFVKTVQPIILKLAEVE